MKKLLFALAALAGVTAQSAETIGVRWTADNAGDLNAIVANCNSSAYNIYIYGSGANWYKLSNDLALAPNGTGFYLSDIPRIDLQEHTLAFKSGSGVSFYNQAGSIFWKNGTIDFTAITGSEYRLLGNSPGTKATTDAGYQNQHGVFENVTIRRDTGTRKSLKMMSGNANCDITMTGSTIDVQGDDLYVFAPNGTATETDGVNNRAVFVNSTIKCGKLYTDASMATPTTPLNLQSEIVFDNSTIEVGLAKKAGGDGTFYLGQVLGGVKVTFTNGSKFTSDVGGWGFDLNVNRAEAQGNTLIVNGGSTLNLNGKNLSIGHAANAAGNSVYLEDCTVNCGQVVLGNSGGSDNHLFIGEGAVVNSTSQFMTKGPDTTMTVSNGTFRLTNYQYAFYFAHTEDSTNNKFTLIGDHPYIEILNPKPNSEGKVNTAELNFKNGMKIDIYLPENGEYKQVPFFVNKFKPSGTAKFRFYNYEELRKKLTANREIVIARADTEMWDLYSEGLPDGCTFKKVDRRETTGYFEAVLTLTPSRAKIAQVGTESFYSFDDAAAKLADNGSMNLIGVAEPEDSFCTLTDKKNVTITSGDLKARMIHDLTLDNTTLRYDVSYGNPNGTAWGVNGYSLTLRNGSQLDIHTQFSVIGDNNTLTIDNSELRVHYRYAIYFGWNNADWPSNGNTLYIRGKRPKIYAENIADGVNNADVSIRKGKVVFELPTNKSDIYTEAPFEGGNSCSFDKASTVEFKNLAALMANLDETLMIPLVKSRVAGNTSIGSALAEPLPAGCSLVKETKDGATTVYLKVVPLGLSAENPFTSISDYNAAVPKTGETDPEKLAKYEALYMGKDLYVVIDGVTFEEGVDYSFNRQYVGSEPESLTQPKLHVFFKNCKFPGGAKGTMSPDKDYGSNPADSNRKEIALCSAKEVVIEGCTFAAYTGDSYVIDINVFNWFDCEDCGITIKDNVFEVGAGNRTPISVKNKIGYPPAFVEITGNTFKGTPTANVICYGDQSGSAATNGGANFPITIENNIFEEGATDYKVMTGLYVTSGKETILVPVEKPFKWYYNERRGEWTAKPAFHQRVGTMILMK